MTEVKVVVKMNNAKFIKTKDANTANLLSKNGLQALPQQGKQFVFVNEPKKMNFEYDASKVFYSNVMMI